MDDARQRMQQAEESARVIKEYQPAYLLSMLRTFAYVAAERPQPDAKTIDDRLRRQCALDDGGKTFDLLLFEGALMWSIGSASIMIDQLEHLRTVMNRPNVKLGLVPAYHPVSVFIGHAFHIYDDSCVAVGTRSGTTITSEAVQVADYLRLFNELRDHAVYDAAADAIIEHSIKRYHAS